jgi:hypothetical protein
MKRLLIFITAAIASAQQLRITIYDKAHLEGKIIEDVHRQIHRIFQHADIEVDILAGDSRSVEAFLVAYGPRPNRLGDVSAACRARRDIALDIIAEAPSGISKGTLGMSLPLADRGLNVRVFANHVAEAASRKHQSYAVLLAYAIAHECGHVLLKTKGHETYGLMASVWKEFEFDLLSRGHFMFFTREQSQRMRATLAGEGCHSAAGPRAEITTVQP